MLNHIVVMGRLTRDPELRYTQSNVPVTSFSVAVDRDFGGRDGAERQTDFIDCVAWRSTGEFVSKYFRKGSMIVVSGRLQIRDWTDRDNNRRRSAEIVADNVYFGESKRRDQSAGGDYSDPPFYSDASRGGSDNGRGASAPRGNAGGGRQSAPAQSYNANQGGFSEMMEEDPDLPF